MVDRLPAIDTAKPAGQQLPVPVRAEIVELLENNVSAAMVGLGNVDNTRDADKPVSGPQADALALKQDLDEKGQPGGYAPLDDNGQVPRQFLGNATATIDFGYCQSELAIGTYPGFETETKIREVLAGIKASGAKRVRAAGWWSAIEPVDEGGYVFTGLDQFLELSAEYGLTPLLVITSDPLLTGARTVADYGQLCGAIAAHCGSGGTNLLHHYEIWNEPNHRGFAFPFNVGSEFGPATYVELLTAASDAIRAADDDAFIISAGLMATADFPPDDIAPSTYLQGIYDNLPPGQTLADLVDAIGLHYYSHSADFSTWQEPSTSQTYYVETLAVRDVMVAEGDADLDVWITEIGFPRTGAVADPNVRAEWLIEQIELLVDLPWVKTWFVYQYKDTDVSTTFGSVDFALVEQNPTHDVVANINAVSPMVPKNSITGDDVVDDSIPGSKLEVSGDGGPTKVLGYAADGSLSAVVPPGGEDPRLGMASGLIGDGRGANTPYVLNTGIVSRDIDIVYRDKVTGERIWMVPEVLDMENPDLGIFTITPNVIWAADRIRWWARGWLGGDVINPTAGTVTEGAKTASTINVTATGFTDDIAVTQYRFWLNGVLVAQQASPNFQYINLDGSTDYTCGITALDAAGNESTLATKVIRTAQPASVQWLASGTAQRSTTVGAQLNFPITVPHGPNKRMLMVIGVSNNADAWGGAGTIDTKTLIDSIEGSMTYLGDAGLGNAAGQETGSLLFFQDDNPTVGDHNLLSNIDDAVVDHILMGQAFVYSGVGSLGGFVQYQPYGNGNLAIPVPGLVANDLAFAAGLSSTAQFAGWNQTIAAGGAFGSNVSGGGDFITAGHGAGAGTVNFTTTGPGNLRCGGGVRLIRKGP